MSEELRNIMTRQSQVSRLRIINTGVKALSNGSRASPGHTDIMFKYEGQGSFVPNALIVGCFDGNGQVINPSPTTFSFTVSDQNLKVLYDGSALYNQSSIGASNNLLNYYDNFDSGVSLNTYEWWYIAVQTYMNGLNAQPYAIGTQFLY
jgi:hypothetical protein